jgi:tRNA-(ms[2]io[6]A)-hydroxylase
LFRESANYLALPNRPRDRCGLGERVGNTTRPCADWIFRSGSRITADGHFLGEIPMLSLHAPTSERWLRQVDQNLDEILIDHAHCEKKAAGCAMNLLFAYVDRGDLCRELAEIVNEELEHFGLVLDLLKRRGIAFRKLRPSGYGRQLNDLVRKFEPDRAVDRLLVAGLIEARSCERFDLLRKYVADPELAAFYESLFESEARHHSTYVRLAKLFASEEQVKQRMGELSELEAEIIARGDPLPRMHS